MNTGIGVDEMVQSNNIDLAIVDIGLPGADGLTLTRSLKESHDIGVIILSGRGDTTEKIVGLEIGADDYVTKPFEPRELLARVRSVLRRLNTLEKPASESSMTHYFMGWKLDLMVRSLTSSDGEAMDMSSGEINLFKAFIEHPNRVLSRDQLLDYTHDVDTPAFDRNVDVQIARLRKKIEVEPQNPQLIKTVRNAGYIFTAKVTHG
jgi:two-component system OmpR family response regulator